MRGRQPLEPALLPPLPCSTPSIHHIITNRPPLPSLTRHPLLALPAYHYTTPVPSSIYELPYTY